MGGCRSKRNGFREVLRLVLQLTNVTCECDDDNAPYAFMQDKEPFERLEPGESFDETVLFVSGSPSKFVITTHWLGADGEEHSRDNIITWQPGIAELKATKTEFVTQSDTASQGTKVETLGGSSLWSQSSWRALPVS